LSAEGRSVAAHDCLRRAVNDNPDDAQLSFELGQRSPFSAPLLPHTHLLHTLPHSLFFRHTSCARMCYWCGIAGRFLLNNGHGAAAVPHLRKALTLEPPLQAEVGSMSTRSTIPTPIMSPLSGSLTVPIERAMPHAAPSQYFADCAV
jgi:hypothetical protein